MPASLLPQAQVRVTCRVTVAADSCRTVVIRLFSCRNTILRRPSLSALTLRTGIASPVFAARIRLSRSGNNSRRSWARCHNAPRSGCVAGRDEVEPWRTT